MPAKGKLDRAAAPNRRIGVILGQVGAPLSHDVSEIRRYLGEFLSDERIIDLPRWRWLPILHGIILQRRPQAVRENYMDIWTEEGSPLIAISNEQRDGIARRLGPQFQVELGLAHSQPNPADAVAKLEDDGVKSLIALPLFPQFSTTTTASFYDAVMHAVLGRSGPWRQATKKHAPTIRTIHPYYNDPSYIRVLANSIRRQLETGPEPDRILVSYHGLPERYIREGDPYLEHCQETTDLLANELGWPRELYEIAFQSRFGREEWIKPYLQPRLTELFQDGVRRPVVISPGFTTDCLETLHELAIDGRQLFAQGGGNPDEYRVISCLNAEPEWLDYLADLIRKNSVGLEVV